ncbi:hypothetical protein GCM10010469_35040 [Streptomyces labedae]|uniref:SDR family oxidoreductase n=1 Tax=Streptomyces labedae TaxID=285569 RepID=A0ABP6QXS9_9ACTN
MLSTEMTAARPEKAQEVADRGIPLRRVGAAREVATAIAFLLSDDASYVTGATWQSTAGSLPDRPQRAASGRRTLLGV